MRLTYKEERKEQAKEAVERGNITRMEKGQTWVMTEVTAVGEFIFIGMNAAYVFFNIVARMSLITGAQIENLKVKTRFALISEDIGLTYKAKFWMEI